MQEKDYILMILMMTGVTYGARVLPFFLFREKEIGGWLKTFIQLVPVALLAALVIPEFVLLPDNHFSLLNPFLFAGICTFIFARRVPNLFLSVLFGMIVFWGLDKII
ncbi:MAG: AzlD domain-containing protein [Peptococcaceae bacterium]|nr:AzlD domain-containing protein [Peptococcaceae bacterium]